MGSRRVRHDWATSLSLFLSCIGEGSGNPLQCSCLENPRDGGAWWAAIYGVTQSRTSLKQLSSSSSIPSFHLPPHPPQNGDKWGLWDLGVKEAQSIFLCLDGPSLILIASSAIWASDQWVLTGPLRCWTFQEGSSAIFYSSFSPQVLF